MNAASPLDTKELVRQAIDIVDLVGESYELRQQGRNFVCRCPWHDDSRPSMTINRERQSWRCWVCGIGGDIFSFVQKRDGVGFREALEMLAERAGVDIRNTNRRPAEAGGPDDKRTLFEAMAYAEATFHRCLLESPEAAPAREYLAGRGINADSIERFRIGFSPDDWDWLKNKAVARGYSTAVLERVGLVRQRQNGGGSYDFFRGRVLFPICDMQARPVAFGGRVMPGADERAGGKYVNSPETPLYSKSKQLYALHLARDAVQRAGQLAVMEGYTDVIMAHQHGLQNVVAVCGTALGEQHLRLITRMTDSVALILDGDDAGQRRASDVLELFLENQVDLRILTLPENLDPCDFIATPKQGPKDGRGVQAMRELLERAPDALQHKLESVTNGLVSPENTHAASRAAEEVLSTLARAAKGGLTNSAAMLREQSILGRLATKLRLPVDQLRSRLGAIRQEQSNKPLAPVTLAPVTLAPVTLAPVTQDMDEGVPVEAYDQQLQAMGSGDQQLLELMLLDADCARRVTESVPPEQLRPGVGRELFLHFRDALEIQGEVDFYWLMNRLEDEQLKSALVAVDEGGKDKQEADRQRWLKDVIQLHKRISESAQRARHKAVLAEETTDDNQESEALKAVFSMLKNRQTGSLPTEG